MGWWPSRHLFATGLLSLIYLGIAYLSFEVPDPCLHLLSPVCPGPLFLGNPYEYICNPFGHFFLFICFMSISSLVQLQELRRVGGKLFFLPTPPKLQPLIKTAGERREVLSIYPPPKHTQAPLPALSLVGNSILPRTKTCGPDSAHQDHPTPPGTVS